MRIREGGRRRCRHYQVNLSLALKLECYDATAVDDEYCQLDLVPTSRVLYFSNPVSRRTPF